MSEERKTYLEQVKEFHRAFKHLVRTTYGIPQDRAKLRLSLLLEELTELAEASGLKSWFAAQLHETALNTVQNIDKDRVNITEQLDALADLQYVLAGAVLEYGFEPVFDKAFVEVHRSNMSKACETIDEVEVTIDMYEDKTGEKHAYERNKETGNYLVFRQSDKKTVKSINYSPANLKQFL